MNDQQTHMRKRPVSEAVQHWRWQRITAVMLVFLGSWLMTAIVTRLQSATPQDVAAWLANPLVAVALATLLFAAFVHKHIGIHEILTDYLHCPTKKGAFNLLLDMASLLLALGAVAAVWHLHLVGAA